MLSSIWVSLQRPLCHHPLNKLMEVWFTNIDSQLKKIWKTIRKQTFFSSFEGFSKFLPFWLNSSTKTQQIWHPWDPWGRVHIDLNKNSVQTGCVQSPTRKKLAIAQSLSGSFGCIFNTFSAIWKSCPCFITVHCKNIQVHATFLVLVFLLVFHDFAEILKYTIFIRS